MRVAVVGSGVAGLVSAWLLSRRYDVTLFEADSRPGGHVHTHEITLRGRRYNVDSGFIVHNPLNYPLLTRLFAELGVESQPTTMSFSVKNEASGLEYNAGTLSQLFCQRQNLVSPRFFGMMLDLLRFYRESVQLLDSPDPGPTLGEYLEQHGYGRAFRQDHIVPMACALWSAPAQRILEFPARYLVQFMANHRMLQVAGRPEWRVVRGGSCQYVQAMRRRWSVRERLNTPVRSIRRTPERIHLSTDAGAEIFDHVVLACHSNQAIKILSDPNDGEHEVVGAIPYQRNEAVLHTDPTVLPGDRKAWAAWNAFVPAADTTHCTVSYCMNLLQGIDSPDPLIVTLNPTVPIDPAKVLRTMQYEHPIYNHASVAARARKAEIQGKRRTWFAGAYWGWGFHEDGVKSAVEVAASLGVEWPVKPGALSFTVPVIAERVGPSA
jgi:predicted NAD/FAD-binding protein